MSIEAATEVAASICFSLNYMVKVQKLFFSYFHSTGIAVKLYNSYLMLCEILTKPQILYLQSFVKPAQLNS